MLGWRVFGGKTGPFPVGRVFHVVRTVATVQCRVEPEQEPTRDFGPVAISVEPDNVKVWWDYWNCSTISAPEIYSSVATPDIRNYVNAY